MDVAVLGAVSNREDWDDTGELKDENNALVDLTGATIVLSLRDRETKRQVLNVSTTGGQITITGLGAFAWHVPVEKMHGICAETYDVGLTVKINGSTSQLAIGTIAVLDGVVP
jgi:hypothetical protein